MNTDTIIVLDFGGSQAYYTARRLRGERFYCEIMRADADFEILRSRSPKGILLAGGDDREEKIALSYDIRALGVPVLAMGRSVKLLAEAIGAEPLGPALQNDKDFVQFMPCDLFRELSENDRYFDRVDGFNLPDGYEPIATTPSGLVPAFGNVAQHIYALQFYVESNDPDGLQILENFAEHICGSTRNWTVENFAPQLIEDVRRDLGDAHVLIPVSSGVDSSVTAALLNRAIGSRVSCLYIESGLMRKGHADLIRHSFADRMGLNLNIVDAEDRFMKALRGITDPAQKRRVLVEEYSAIFTEEYIRMGDLDCVTLGTIYSDIIKSKPRLLMGMIDGCRVYEPMRMLFKEEMRQLGHYLGVPEELMGQPSFANNGLAIRCLGEVTIEKLYMLREADAIFREEVERANYSHRIAQYFVILTDIQTPGLGGSGYVCVLRALGTSNAGKASAYRMPYDLMDAVVSRITGEVAGINHVVYDITGRPTASVEWE